MLFDLHNDFPTAISEKEFYTYVKSLKETLPTAAVWTSELGENAFDVFVSIVGSLRQKLPNVPIAIEDIGFLGECARYESFDFSDYMYCSLCWNYDNVFAGGALDSGDLTQLGKKAIRLIERCGCAVDLAHLNKRSFYEVIDRADRILCSHTGFGNHPRSLDAEQTKALVERNAVIGLCTVRTFTGANSAIELADVIDGFVQRYGDRCLALGTDFYGSQDIPDDIKDYNGLRRVADALYRRGYDKAAVDNIFYNNSLALLHKEKK